MPFSNPPFSNIREHALSFDHSIKVDNFSVLARCPSHDLKGPIHDSDFNRNRDVQPDRGCGAVDGLPTHAAIDLFNLSQFSDSNNVGPRL